jgi:predicted dienelactone hydrolase
MSFPSVTDFGAKGPFATTKDDATTIASLQSASCTIYRPTTLGGDAGVLQHPVVVWGNGTGTPTELVYEWLFTQWASHGFVVAAANTPNAGTGVEMLGCLDWVQTQSTTPGSPYQGHVATTLVAASGHSQGGGGAIMAGRDPRVTLTVPFMAYTQGLGYEAGAAAAQHGPMLLMSGSADTIAPPTANQLPVFQDTTVPTFWGTLAGADHITFALGGEAGYLAPSTAWLRLFLMCDESARPMFYGASCTLCTESNWTVQRKGI